jgi:hypothetical protein
MSARVRQKSNWPRKSLTFKSVRRHRSEWKGDDRLCPHSVSRLMKTTANGRQGPWRPTLKESSQFPRTVLSVLAEGKRSEKPDEKLTKLFI